MSDTPPMEKSMWSDVEDPAEDVVEQDRDQEQAAADEGGEDEDEVLDGDGDRRHALPPPGPRVPPSS